MAYSTYTDVQSDFKDQAFASMSGNVTREDVTQFIVESDALINAYVGSVYVIPVAAGGGLELLKLFSRSLTAVRVKRVLEVKQQLSPEANQNILETLLSPSQVLKQLELIQKKNIVLEGATPLVSSGGFFSKNAHCDVEPVIKKDEKQW